MKSSNKLLGVRSRKVSQTFGLLFFALCTLALLSAPGATQDEPFHLTNFYCGHGERSPYCTEIRFDLEFPGALVATDYSNCQKRETVPLACPAEGSGFSFRSINQGLYPGGMYWLLSWAITPNQELNVILIRIASALVVCLALSVTATILPVRHQQVMYLQMLTTLPATGYFLFASLNPSSWTILGVGFGWLSAHAALTISTSSRKMRAALLVTSIMSWSLAISSRWDATPFIVFTVCLVTLRSCILRFGYFTRLRGGRLFAVLATLISAAGIVALTELIVPNHVSPMAFATHIVSYTFGEPNNLTFFSHNLLDAIPMSLRALSSVPTLSPIGLPRILSTISVSALVLVLIQSHNWKSRSQLTGLLVNVVAVAVVVMGWVDFNDNRNPFGIEPRYVLPILVFAVGWWLIDAPTDSLQTVTQKTQLILPFSVLAYALMAFSVAERYVDRQTFGIRILPEGADNWWWSFIPVGPNVILVLSIIMFSWHLKSFRALVLSAESDRG